MSNVPSKRNLGSPRLDLWHLARLTVHSFKEQECPLRAAFIEATEVNTPPL